MRVPELPQHGGPTGHQKALCELGIGYRSGHRQRADAGADSGSRTLVRIRDAFRDDLAELVDETPKRSGKRAPRGTRASPEVGGIGGEGARGADPLQVARCEVVLDPLERSLDRIFLVALARLAEPRREFELYIHDAGEQVFLRLEVRVEAAAREARVCHDLVDRSAVKSLASKEAPRRFDDALPHAFGVLLGVSHDIRFSRQFICWRTYLAAGRFRYTEPVARPDPHSFHDDSQPVADHLRWRAIVDFETKKIRATSTLTFPESAGAGPIDFDTRDLSIHRVRAGDRDLDHALDLEDAILGHRLRVEVPERTTEITIEYETSEGASALQWLAPAQTAGGGHPFLFTQCQAIHARSVMPIQDTPRARIRFAAEIDVPRSLRALVAAGFVERREDGERAVEHWAMEQSIPPYLFAFAVGHLEGRDLGPRTRVWTEPERLDEAAWEFAEVESLLAAGEKLFGPYDWERYDFLVMPPSFPYGGMENPRLTFLTPSLLAGDRSQVGVLAHELAHSWTGNLITNASAEDFWLNEGWTRYAEQRIVEEVYGVELSDLQIAVGTSGLERTIARFEREGRPELSRLKTELAGVDPDDAFSDVPYEKGLLFLRSLEREIGRERFDGFLRTYIDTFRFRSITTAEFVAFAEEKIPDALRAIDAPAWIHEPGLPAGAALARSARIERVEALGRSLPSDEQAESFDPIEWQLWLEAVPDADRAWCEEVDQRFHLTAATNAEVLCAWLAVAIACDYQPAVERAAAFLGESGRMKFLKPLYAALASRPDGVQTAREIFARHEAGYHPIARAVVGALLDGASSSS